MVCGVFYQSQGMSYALLFMKRNSTQFFKVIHKLFLTTLELGSHYGETRTFKLWSYLLKACGEKRICFAVVQTNRAVFGTRFVVLAIAPEPTSECFGVKYQQQVY